MGQDTPRPLRLEIPESELASLFSYIEAALNYDNHLIGPFAYVDARAMVVDAPNLGRWPSEKGGFAEPDDLYEFVKQDLLDAITLFAADYLAAGVSVAGVLSYCRRECADYFAEHRLLNACFTYLCQHHAEYPVIQAYILASGRGQEG